MKLAAYLSNPDGSLADDKVSDDTACDLGKWIYGEGLAGYGKDSEYLRLKTSHALFHLAAAQVIREVDRGEEVSASLYRRASSDMVSHIVRLAAQASG